MLSLAVRSMFTALPLESLDGPPSSEQTGYWVERIRLTRFMLDLAAEFGALTRRETDEFHLGPAGPLAWPA